MAHGGLETENAPQVSATRARQGSWGRHILWVLIISTTLAALAMLASPAFHSNELEGRGGQTAAPAAGSFDSPVVEPRSDTPTG